MTCGSMYSWGSLNIYVTSYYKNTSDPDLSIKSGSDVFVCIVIVNAVTYPFAVR
jgi:hypothetical protein